MRVTEHDPRKDASARRAGHADDPRSDCEEAVSDAQLDAYGNLLGATLATAGAALILAVLTYIVIDTIRMGKK